MANLNTSADVLNYILFNGGEPIDGTSDYATAVIEYLNRAYLDMCNGGGSFDPEVNEDWWWLKKDPPGVIILAPSIELGSVSVTNNSASITFSSAPPISVAGYFFKVSTHPDVFRVSAHTAASATATLDSVYTGATSATATFKLFKTEYTLAADVLRITAPMRIYSNSMAEVDGVELSALERDHPISFVESGTPNQFAMVTESKVRFNRYGEVNDTTKFIRVEYDYVQLPTDLTNSGSETPLFLVPIVVSSQTWPCTICYRQRTMTVQVSWQAKPKPDFTP